MSRASPTLHVLVTPYATKANTLLGKPEGIINKTASTRWYRNGVVRLRLFQA